MTAIPIYRVLPNEDRTYDVHVDHGTYYESWGSYDTQAEALASILKHKNNNQ